MNHADIETIGHVARLAILAMCARAVAGAEFETSDEIRAMRLTVSHPVEGEQSAVDVEFLSVSGVPVAGMAL